MPLSQDSNSEERDLEFNDVNDWILMTDFYKDRRILFREAVKYHRTLLKLYSNLAVSRNHHTHTILE